MKKLLGILGTITIAGSGMAGLVGNAPAPAKNEINYQKADNLENLNRNKRENYNKPIIIDSYQLKDWGVWFETYWYWFGYCRLHFSHNEIESLIEGGHSITELAQQIAEAFPPASTSSGYNCWMSNIKFMRIKFLWLWKWCVGSISSITAWNTTWIWK